MLKRLRRSFKRDSSRPSAAPPQAEEISLEARGLVSKGEPLLCAGASPSPVGDDRGDADGLYVQEAAAIGIRERSSGGRKGRYVFVVRMTWSNSAVSHSYKSYSELFEFHCALLDMFPEEAGQVLNSSRSIPYLPGRSILRRSTLQLAQERLPEIHGYVQDLFKLPPEVSHCDYVLNFFRSDTEESEGLGLKEEDSEPFLVGGTSNHRDVLPEGIVHFDNPDAVQSTD